VGVAGVRRADAAAAQAAAELEVARRGLVAAVTGLFYGLAAADNKLADADRAHNEAVDFTKLTTEREQAREAAHADVVKAQLEEQQRERDLSDRAAGCREGAAGAGRVAVSRSEGAVPSGDPQGRGGAGGARRCGTGRGKNNPELKGALATLSVSMPMCWRRAQRICRISH